MRFKEAMSGISVFQVNFNMEFNSSGSEFSIISVLLQDKIVCLVASFCNFMEFT